jgi:hypothetical protein
MGAGVSAKTVCPVAPPPGSTINGGLIVNGVCILDHVTVHGGVTVQNNGHLELEFSTVDGGVNVEPGGELDSGHLVFSTVSTFNPSTIHGGVVATNPLDLDLINATVDGGVTVNGNPFNSTPSICQSHISGGISLTNIAQGFAGGFNLGDPGAEGFNCPGNDINGTVHVSNSPGLIEIEANTIQGSVLVENSTLELAGNTISGSAKCTNTVFASDGDPAPNQLNGQNSCP